MQTTPSGEKERDSIVPRTTKERDGCVERKVRKFNEGLKADAQSSSHAQSTSQVDVQILKNTALTIAEQVFARSLEEDEETEILIHRLSDAHDHETLLILGRVHYKIGCYMEIFPLADVQSDDVYREHCEKAHECYLVLQREAPGLYDSVRRMLKLTRDMLNKLGLYPEPCDEELSDTSDSVFMSDLCCNMEEDMIQDAVERLLEAMSTLPDDNNRNVIDKLATQIYFSPWTGNKQADECREGLMASAKDAKEALAQHPRDAPKLKEGALALILLRERLTREVYTNVTETRLHDAITMLEEVLMIHPNDCEATLYLGKGHYYLWLDSTLHLDSAVRETYRQKAIEYFSAVRDKAAAPVMVNEAEDLLDTLYERHTEDNHNRPTDENVMLIKFVGVLFEAMLLGTDQRCKVAEEKSVKDHMLVQELTSLRRQVDAMLMKLSKSL